MELCRYKMALSFVLVALIILFNKAQTQTTGFTFDDTEFGFFKTSPAIDQPDAQTQCINWGGNLATIKSDVEDSLLFYSSPDIGTFFTCHIGLNRTVGGEFEWIDGSTSSYRNWGTIGEAYPSTNANHNCVRNRYRFGSTQLSQGWLNIPCDQTRNCYMCSKSGMSNGCDLIYGSSCYKVFEVSTPINWLDAQSSCAIWGGDLTSITTERENNYLNTIVNSSVGNSWIGLNDRDTEGMYTWIDGTAVSYTNWTTPPDFANRDCVQINNAVNGMWESVMCDITLNAFVCKRDSSSDIPTVVRFGRITNGGLVFEALTGNTFFYESQTLVCRSDDNSVVWEYSQNSDLSGGTTIPETSNYVDFSWLDVNNTMQGYYRCTLGNSVSYTVGVYDTTLTTVAVTGDSYTYIVGVDRTDVLLLCDPKDGGSLSMLRWSAQGGTVFNNPINLTSESSNLPNVQTYFSCKRGNDVLNTTQICVKVPTISVNYGVVPTISYSSVFPAMNTVLVPSEVQEITLSTNIEGKWTLPDNSESTNSILTVPNFSSQNNGVYKFYINNWDKMEVCAIQIIILTGDPEIQFTSSDTDFAFFNTSVINWHSAQMKCIDWGGNLTTIKSDVEDSLLFYSSTDIGTFFTCHIGLNRIGGSKFEWIDGSNSSYRNWGTIGQAYPVADTNLNCVRNRYRPDGVLSQGWLNIPCSETRNCYMCSKSGMSNGCDLIYNSSCYKVFEVNTLINWLDAQSSCAIWGGDLTSITTERENNYLNTIITSTVGNCWIGLSDRDTEGIYTWVDGIAVNYTNWTSTPSNTASSDCFQINNAGNGMWESVNCEDTSNTFVCKRPSNFSLQEQFGQLVNGGLDFEVLQNDTIFQGSLTLVCLGDLTSVIKWKYSQNLDLTDNEEVDATFYSREYGLSWLKVNDSKQGVYMCQINNRSYKIVLYRQISEISRLNTSILLNYTVGSIQILYYPNDDIKKNIKWTPDEVKDGDTDQYSIELPNPVEISTILSAIGTGVHTMTAFYRMSPVTLIRSIELAIKDTVEVTISYENFTQTTSDVSNQLFPSPKEITIQGGTKNIKFTCNMPNCTWKIENQNSEMKVIFEPYDIDTLTEDNEGTYSLIRKTRTGQEYLTAQVYINVTSSETQTIIIVIAVITIIAIICLIVIVLLIIILVWKQRSSTRFSKQKLKTDDDTLPKDMTDKPGYSQEHNDQAYFELKDIVETDLTNNNSSSETQLKQNDSEVAYEEVTEILDPKMVPIPLDVFKMHMNKIWKNEGALLEEYESLGGKSHRYSCKYGTIEENKVKNRFKLIYPYDKSRVTLIPKNNGTNCDYINASVIPGYYTKECFIAAQGPKDNTMQDFWQMILERNVVNIVMVTNLVESGRRKCEAYFSQKIGKKVVIGPYEINLDKEEVRTGYTIRKMSVHHMGNITQVKHFHFTAWPDHDVPTLYDELLLFVSKVQEGHIKTKAPILVHCSAGVGRTGTFISLYNLMTAIQQNKPINIYNTVNAMREHRPQMVQAFAQYKFVYLSVLEILLGNTSIPTQEFMETFNSYMKSEETGYVSVFFEQFSELNYQCEKAFDPVCTAALEGCNSKKNPINDILPNDSNRVVLYAQQWEGDYINASDIEGGEIILTIHPTAETLQNFYQLLYQVGPSLVVMLCTKNELQSIQKNKSQRVSYWPNLGESLQTDSFMITCENHEKSHFIRNKLNLQQVEEQSNKLFTQIITDSWNENGEPDVKKNVLILQAMLEFRKQFPEGPIVIHCKDGAGISGVLYTVYKCIKDSTEKGSIDIFHTVKKLRNERMNSVSTLNQLLACYKLMNEYMYRIP